MYARSAAHFLFRGFPHVIESLKAIEVAGRKAIAIGKKEQEQARTQPGNLGGSSTGSVPLLRQNAVELLSECSGYLFVCSWTRLKPCFVFCSRKHSWTLGTPGRSLVSGERGSGRRGICLWPDGLPKLGPEYGE
jgi:hypothetical protein